MSESEKASSVLNLWQQLTDSSACQRSGCHTHQLWFSSWTFHPYFYKHSLFTASQSIIKTDFPKEWVARKIPNTRRGGRQKTTIESFGVNKTIIVMIMGFSFSTFLISAFRNWFPPKQKSVCGVTSGRQTKFTAMKRPTMCWPKKKDLSNVLPLNQLVPLAEM